ncbi:MAG TPA: CHAT domain-containing protein [Anaerolineae bacterium]|nr:CHAT domain-containing protein [Anaerolineae bacterium]HQM14319.1 CHAT domain-containing protein [Anaerolineae bacterium]
MSTSTSDTQDIAITITKHYRPCLEFSVVSTDGLYEILRLYVEVTRMYYCVPGPTMIEALFFSTNYTLTLVPTIRIYPLFPPTINSRDTWLLKGKDADLFGITFDWPGMMAVDVVIKAEVYDHIGKRKKIVASETIKLQRNGERIADKESKRFSFFADYVQGRGDFVPDDNPIPLTPYLYKLVTIDGFIERVNVPEATQLNKEAYHEIATLFRCDTSELESLLREKPKRDLMFKADVHPAFAARLIEIAPILHSYLGDKTMASMTILFLSADPTNVSRLRLGEEFREIQEKLKLAKLRECFNLELPQLSVRPADISQALLDVQPQIVHFSGHGTSTGALCFENQTGQTQLVQPDALAALFEQFAEEVKCVLLNACYSETQAKAIGKHIKYVIGMNQAIGDKAAIAFAIGFYQALGAGRTIEDAYKLGCVQIRLQGIPEHLTPVLIKEGQLQP